MDKPAPKKKQNSRIQREKRELILAAALEVFAAHGFRGSTIDQIAVAAGLSKPNLLYYFANKEEMHQTLIERLMDTWLDPLKDIRADGEPMAEICAYIKRKLQMSRDFPKESRLFANEILQGAPRIITMIEGELKSLVDQKAAIIQGWMNQGQLNPCDARHLLFAIWATTQHYADFDVQVRSVLAKEAENDAHFDAAAVFLENLFCKGLKPHG